MGTSYSIKGTITVRDCLEVHGIIDDPDELIAWCVADITKLNDGNIEVTISGLQYGSYTWVNEVDNALEELSPYVTVPALLEYEIHGTRGDMWIGSEDLVEKATQELLAVRAREAISEMTPENRKAFIHQLLNDGLHV